MRAFESPVTMPDYNRMNKTMTQGVHIDLDELIGARFAAQRMRFVPRNSARAARAGGHASRFRGRGMDFEEVRAYQPGDDIRSMDWRVTARTGRPHTKVFREERERPVLFAVDSSASLRFGTRVAFKHVVAARVAAFWAWCAARHGDRVGGVVFSESGGVEIKPRAGQVGVLRLLRTLAEHAPAPTGEQGAGLHKALQHLRSVTRPGSLVVLISDFWGWDESCESLLADIQRHSEFVAVQIYDTLEQQLPQAGRYAVSDGVNTLAIDTTQVALRAAYQQRYAQHARTVQDVMQRRAVNVISVATHDDPFALLSRELRVLYGR